MNAEQQAAAARAASDAWYAAHADNPAQAGVNPGQGMPETGVPTKARVAAEAAAEYSRRQAEWNRNHSANDPYRGETINALVERRTRPFIRWGGSDKQRAIEAQYSWQHTANVSTSGVMAGGRYVSGVSREAVGTEFSTTEQDIAARQEAMSKQPVEIRNIVSLNVRNNTPALPSNTGPLSGLLSGFLGGFSNALNNYIDNTWAAQDMELAQQHGHLYGTDADAGTAINAVFVGRSDTPKDLAFGTPEYRFSRDEFGNYGLPPGEHPDKNVVGMNPKVGVGDYRYVGEYQYNTGEVVSRYYEVNVGSFIDISEAGAMARHRDIVRSGGGPGSYYETNMAPVGNQTRVSSQGKSTLGGFNPLESFAEGMFATVAALPVLQDISKAGRAFALEGEVAERGKKLDEMYKGYEQSGLITKTAEGKTEFKGTDQQYNDLIAEENRLKNLEAEKSRLGSELTGGQVALMTMPVYERMHGGAEWWKENVAKPFEDYTMAGATQTNAGVFIEENFGMGKAAPGGNRALKALPIFYSPRIVADLAAGFVSVPSDIAEFGGMSLVGGEIIARNPMTLPALAIAGGAMQIKGMYEGATTNPARFLSQQAGMAVIMHGTGIAVRRVSPIGIGSETLTTRMTGARTTYTGIYLKMPLVGEGGSAKMIAGVARFEGGIRQSHLFTGSPDTILASRGFSVTPRAEKLYPWTTMRRATLDTYLEKHLPKTEARLVKAQGGAVDAAYSILLKPEQRALFGEAPSSSVTPEMVGEMAEQWAAYHDVFQAGGSRAVSVWTGRGGRWESLMGSDFDNYATTAKGMRGVYQASVEALRQHFPNVENTKGTFIAKAHASIRTIASKEFFHVKLFEKYPYMEAKPEMIEAVGGAKIASVNPRLLFNRKVSAMVSSIEQAPMGTPKLGVERVKDIADAYAMSRAFAETLYHGSTVDFGGVITKAKVSRGMQLEEFSNAALEFADSLNSAQRAEAMGFFREMKVDLLKGANRRPTAKFDLLTGQGIVSPESMGAYRAGITTVAAGTGMALIGPAIGAPKALGAVAGVIFPGMKGGDLLALGEAKLTRLELEYHLNQKVYGKWFKFEQAGFTTSEGRVLDTATSVKGTTTIQLSPEFINSFGFELPKNWKDNPTFATSTGKLRSRYKYATQDGIEYAFDMEKFETTLEEGVTMHTHPAHIWDYLFKDEKPMANQNVVPSDADMAGAFYNNPRQQVILHEQGATVIEIPPEVKAMSKSAREDWYYENVEPLFTESLYHGFSAEFATNLFQSYGGEGFMPHGMTQTMLRKLPLKQRIAYGYAVSDMSQAQFARAAAKLELKVSFVKEVNPLTGVGKVEGFSPRIQKLARMYEMEALSSDMPFGTTVFRRRMLRGGEEGIFVPEAEARLPFEFGEPKARTKRGLEFQSPIIRNVEIEMIAPSGEAGAMKITAAVRSPIKGLFNDKSVGIGLFIDEKGARTLFGGRTQKSLTGMFKKGWSYEKYKPLEFEQGLTGFSAAEKFVFDPMMRGTIEGDLLLTAREVQAQLSTGKEIITTKKSFTHRPEPISEDIWEGILDTVQRPEYQNDVIFAGSSTMDIFTDEGVFRKIAADADVDTYVDKAKIVDFSERMGELVERLDPEGDIQYMTDSIVEMTLEEYKEIAPEFEIMEGRETTGEGAGGFSFDYFKGEEGIPETVFDVHTTIEFPDVVKSTRKISVSGGRTVTVSAPEYSLKAKTTGPIEKLYIGDSGIKLNMNLYRIKDFSDAISLSRQAAVDTGGGKSSIYYKLSKQYNDYLFSDKIEAQVRATSLKKADAAWLEENPGKTAENLYADMMEEYVTPRREIVKGLVDPVERQLAQMRAAQERSVSSGMSQKQMFGGKKNVAAPTMDILEKYPQVFGGKEKYPMLYPTVYPKAYPSLYPKPYPVNQMYPTAAKPYPTVYPTKYPTVTVTKYPVTTPTKYPVTTPPKYPTTTPPKYPVVIPPITPPKPPEYPIITETVLYGEELTPTPITWRKKKRRRKRKNKKNANEWYIWNPVPTLETTFGMQLNIKELIPKVDKNERLMNTKQPAMKLPSYKLPKY